MRFKRIEIVLNILFWGIMIWAFVFGNGTMDIVSTEIIEGKVHKVLVRSTDKIYAALIAQFLFILFFYTELYLIHKLKKPKAVKGFVLKSIGLFFGTLIIYVLLIIIVVFPNDENAWEINTVFFMTVFHVAVVACYGFTKKWIQHERDRQQLELIKNQAELSLLRQQLQPHFLFNTMNNLLAMVHQNDNPRLAQSIDKLSGLLRYVVYDTNNEKVTIAQEITFFKNFAELHLLRFEDDEINFKCNVIGTYDQQPIEPGVFLCYVENAFKHGVQPEENAFITIDIDISKANKVEFKIENSIPKHPFENQNGGFGISSNQERLDLVYPDKHSIYLERKETYKVELIIETV